MNFVVVADSKKISAKPAFMNKLQWFFFVENVSGKTNEIPFFQVGEKKKKKEKTAGKFLFS